MGNCGWFVVKLHSLALMIYLVLVLLIFDDVKISSKSVWTNTSILNQPCLNLPHPLL